MTRVTDLAYYPLKSAGGVPVPEAVVELTRARYVEAYETLTGHPLPSP